MTSIQKTARLTGLLYLVIAALSAFGLVYVPSMIIVPEDAAATANNIVASESLFRLGAHEQPDHFYRQCLRGGASIQTAQAGQ